MLVPFSDLHSEYLLLRDEIDSAIQTVIDESAFIHGEQVDRFEEAFSKACNTTHAIGCGNGTDAIFIALRALGIGEGDEVITTALTWISTAEAISLTGALPVFVDIEPSFKTIDSSKVEAAITSRTKAIIPVHLYGHPANLTVLQKIAEKHSLALIEDCAQAHLATWQGRPVGSFGDFGTFSFYPGKNLGAYGDAGCLVTSDYDLATRARRFANHGALAKHDHLIEGINSRLDGLQAAVLNVKLKRLRQWTKQRQAHASMYQKLLSGLSSIILPKTHCDASHVFHLYVIQTDNRDSLKSVLLKNEISCAIHYPLPLPLLPAYRHLKLRKEMFPVACATTQTILSIPIYPGITSSSLNLVRHTIARWEKTHRD